jgi:protein-S-isoprenylcysteine O-methyltransferase Ste14
MAHTQAHSDRLRRRVIALFFAGLLFLAMLAVGIGWVCAGWGSFQMGWINHFLGPVLAASGLALVVWSVHVQVVLGRGTPAPQVATLKLVTQGPYAYTRNPMTLGALLLYLGISAWMGSGVVLILTVVVFGALLTFIYVHETRELTERFGNAYLEYRQKTPFLLPRWKR